MLKHEGLQDQRVRRAATLVLALPMLTLAGCGDGDRRGGDGGSAPGGNVVFAPVCDTPAPCGGDLLGQWQIVGGCVQQPNPFSCTGAIDRSRGSISGMMTFAADSYELEVDYDLFPTFELQGECVCGDTSLGELRILYSTATCAGCTCGASLGRARSTGGMYTVSGTTLMREDETFEYCVEGSTLTLIASDRVDGTLSVQRLERAE